MLRQLLESPPATLQAVLPPAWRTPIRADIAAMCRHLEALALHTSAVPEVDPKLDESVLAQLFEAGLFRLTVPAEYGGLACSMRDFVLVMEAIGRIGPAYAMTAVPHLCISVKAVASLCEPARAAEILADIQRRNGLLAFAITEDSGSDLASMTTRLSRAADGSWRLNGRKQWITNLARASHVVVAALCPDLHPAPGAVTLLVVALEQSGVGVSTAWVKHCCNGSDTADLYFDNVEIVPESLLGQPGQGMRLFNEMVLPGRLGAAAAAVGLVREALRSAAADPASPLTPHHITRLEAALDALRATVCLSAALGDADHPEFPMLCALAKHLCSREAQQLALEIEHAYAKRGRASPASLRRAVQALGLFRLLKGPGDMLSLQAISSWVHRVGTLPLPATTWPYPIRLATRQVVLGFTELHTHGGASANPLMAMLLADATAAWWMLFAVFSANHPEAQIIGIRHRQHARRWAWRRFSAPARRLARLVRGPAIETIDGLYDALLEANRSGKWLNANSGAAA